MALRVTTIMSGISGSPFYNLLHFPGSGSTDADAAGTAASAFWDGLKATMQSGLTIQVQPDVEEFDPLTGELEDVHSFTDDPIVCTGGGDALPYGTNGVVRLRTGLFSEGREIRGRIFLPAQSEGSNTAGVPNSTFAGVVNPLAVALAASLAVWQRPRKADSSHTPPITARPGSIAPVSSASLSNKWSMLRTRRE